MPLVEAESSLKFKNLPQTTEQEAYSTHLQEIKDNIFIIICDIVNELAFKNLYFWRIIGPSAPAFNSGFFTYVLVFSFS